MGTLIMEDKSLDVCRDDSNPPDFFRIFHPGIENGFPFGKLSVNSYQVLKDFLKTLASSLLQLLCPPRVPMI